MGENWWKWVKMGENGWKWVKMGENWVKIGENWKFHFYEFLVIFCNFGWFQAILVHFVQFVKGVVQFLKGDGQLVKGADSLKLLSKLAVFPLLLIFDDVFRISRQIPENSDVCRFFNQICENKSEICRKFWILWKKFTIIQNYSLVSLINSHADY